MRFHFNPKHAPSTLQLNCQKKIPWIRIQSGQWIRIRIQEGKMTHKSRNISKVHVLVLDVPFFLELKASSVTWTFFMEA
jgi:hypothetical protein